MTGGSIAIIEDTNHTDMQSFECAISTLNDDVHAAIVTHIQGLTAAYEKALAQNRSVVGDLETRNSELEFKIEHEARANEELASEVRAKTMLVGKLQEKVIDQGRVVSELCKEVDRLHKENDALTLKANLVGRLQEKVVDQGRMVSELCKEVDKLSKEKESLMRNPTMPRLVPASSGTMDDSIIANKSSRELASPVRALIPNVEHCPVGSRQLSPASPYMSTRAPPAVPNMDSRRQRRRVSMPGGGSYASEERTINNPMRRSNQRRMSTGAAACA